MKKLSDYKGEEAINLWADLFDPLSEILTNEEVRKVVASGQPKLLIAKAILKNSAKEATDILTRIDPTPLDGLNIIIRLVDLVAEIGQNEEIRSFFGYAEQEKTEGESSGSPTETTEVKGK